MTSIGFKSTAGANVKHARSASTSIGGGLHGDITVTWNDPFADTNYTVTASAQRATSADIQAPRIYVKSKTTTGITVRVGNEEPVSAQNFIVHAMGIAD